MLGGADLHDDDDERTVTILTDDERPFVLYDEQARTLSVEQAAEQAVEQAAKLTAEEPK